MKREFRNAALILVGLVLLIYGQSFLGDSLVGGADVIRSAYPIRYHFWSIVMRGELPTWSPYLMGGYPIIVEEQASAFYPPEWVFGLFRNPQAYNFIIAFHVWLAGLGAYILARKLRLSTLAAWTVAVIAILGAPLTARVAAGHPSHLFGRALMVWALVAILYLAERPGWWPALGLAVVFGSQLLIGIGNYQTALYTAVVAILFSVFVFRTRVKAGQKRGFILWGLLALMFAVGLGAVRAAPTIDIGLQSSRQEGLSAESLNYGALPPVMILGYFLPHAFDDPSITDYTWPEFALYVGSAPIILALIAALKRRRESAVQFWIVVTALFLILSLGSVGGLFSIFSEYFPGYQFFRNPARHGMVTSLGVMMLAGYGVDAIYPQITKPTGRYRVRWIVGIGIGLLILLAASTFDEGQGPSIELLTVRLTRGGIWFLAAISVFYLAHKLLVAQPSRWPSSLLVAVVAFDLILYAYPQIYQESVPAELPYVTPQNLAGGLLYGTAFLEENELSDWGNVNTTAENGVRLINMYTGVIPMRMARIVNLLAGRPAHVQHEENQILLDRFARADVLDFLGIRYILVPHGYEVIDDPSLVSSKSLDQVQILENIDARPFAILVPDFISGFSQDSALEFIQQSEDLASGAVAVEGLVEISTVTCTGSPPFGDGLSNISLRGGNLDFEFEAPEAGILVVNQGFMEGWDGWVNGEPAEVYAVNYVWIGIHLPCPGHYEIRLRYLPPSLQIGLGISIITLLLIISISLLVARSSSKENGRRLRDELLDGPL